MKKIQLLIPIFNEENSIKPFLDNIYKVLPNEIAESQFEYELIFIDDGSKDKSLSILKGIGNNKYKIIIIELSRNFGKEAALTAGVDYFNGDALIPIDVDLQDPPEIIEDMLRHWIEGYDVVLAKREDRTTDKFLKRTSSKIFYKFHNSISSIKIPENVGDFRLMDKKVVMAIKSYKERNRFMKGIFADVGFKSITIGYKRKVRENGKSNFPAHKLINLAIEGFTSFSLIPLRFFTYFGFFTVIMCFIYIIYIIYLSFYHNIEVKGFASLIIIITFLGSVQLIGIGILGEYLGKNYTESKNRPIYIVNDIYINKNK